MKKSTLAIIIAVVAVVVVVSIVGALVFTGMLSAFFGENGPPDIEEASIALSLGGFYDSETGLYYMDGTADNMGKKAAVNCRFEVTFYNLDTDEDLKTETVTVGDVPAESSKPIDITVQLASGLTHVGYRTENPLWD